MSESLSSILPLPEQEITERTFRHVDRDHGRAWEIAGPLFDAGCTSINLPTLPEYKGAAHLLPRHRINLVVQGKMRFRSGLKTKIAKPGDLVITPAGINLQRTGLEPTVWLFIELEDIAMWAPLKTIGLSMRKYESADLLYILTRRIIGALRSQDVYSMKCARESSVTILNLLRRELIQADNPWSVKNTNRFVRLLDDIRERPDLNWDRGTIAQSLKMSERSVVREFKRIFNLPPSKMVTNIRMDIAARLLIGTDKKLSDIASFIGYQSAFSFSRIFKKHIGISPERYRGMSIHERNSTTSEK